MKLALTTIDFTSKFVKFDSRKIPLGPRDKFSRMSLATDAEGHLLRQILTARGGSQPVIDSYNSFVRYRLPKILEARPLELANGDVVTFTEPYYIRPKILNDLGGAGGEKDLYPFEARLKKRTYSARLFCKMVRSHWEEVIDPQTRTRGHSLVPKEVLDIFLGEIPVMIHSELDHLAGLTSAQREAKGESPVDPGGYFVIKGAEKVLLNIEKLRTLAPFLYEDKHGFIVRYTSTTTLDSTIVVVLELSKQEASKDIHVTFTKMGLSKSINIFYIFYLLGLTVDNAGNSITIDKSLEIMETFIIDDDPVRQARRRKELRQYLQKTINTFTRQTGMNHELILEKFGGKISDVNIKNTADRNDRLVNLVREELFKNIPLVWRTGAELNSILKAKIRLLASMVAKFVDFKNGYRAPDDRDSWANKKISDAGDHMSTQMNVIWKSIWNSLKKSVTDKRITTLQEVRNAINANELTESFNKAFTQGIWGGARGDGQKTTIVDTLKRDTLMAVWAHIRRISTPINRRSRIRRIRLIDNSSWGVACPVMSPEGESCGLVKDSGLVLYISLERDDQIIRARIENQYYPGGPQPNARNSVYLNGVHLGYTEAKGLYRRMVDMRRQQLIYFDTGLVLDEYNDLWIMTNSGRACRPLLIVNPETQRLLIDELGLRGRSLDELMFHGALEYLDVAEQIQPYIYIAETIQHLRNKIDRRVTTRDRLATLENDPEATPGELASARQALQNVQNERPYTHCEIDPTGIMGDSASITPFPEFMPAPRGAYQSSMAKQALAPNSSRFELRFDTTVKTLTAASVPQVATDMHEFFGLDQYPAGDNAVVAVTTYGGENQEDAIILNEDSVNRGKFNLAIYHSYKTIKSQQNKHQEILRIPNHAPSQDSRYSNLNPETAIVRLGSYVKPGDCLVGKVVITRDEDGNQQVSDASLYVEIGKKGYVEDIFRTINSDRDELIQVRLRENLTPQPGDKFASRYAQKGVVGAIYPGVDMPIIQSEHPFLNGVTPDIIFNPHGIPSRMTMNKLYEIHISLYAALTGERINATGFRRFSYEEYRDALVRMGYSSTGKEKMMNGKTGRTMDVEIFVGSGYYQVLRHLVESKMRARGTGAAQFLTRQPISGIRKDGGLKVGEMERDAFIEHGGAYTLQDRLMISSDAYSSIVCRRCGTFAYSMAERGEIKCRNCRHGPFGRITTPYSFRLFVSLLAGLGVKVKLGTREVAS
jgi:DNA-directed RNA polymerase II subunit RPB2